MKLRREVMKLDKLDMFDMYNPLLPGCRREYSFPEAVGLVREALKPLGEDYAKNLELAFTQRWVDVPERRGKRSGAYSSGCYDSYPYLLLNYNRTLNDVFTLAPRLPAPPTKSCSSSICWRSRTTKSSGHSCTVTSPMKSAAPSTARPCSRNSS